MSKIYRHSMDLYEGFGLLTISHAPCRRCQCMVELKKSMSLVPHGPEVGYVNSSRISKPNFICNSTFNNDNDLGPGNLGTGHPYRRITVPARN